MKTLVMTALILIQLPGFMPDCLAATEHCGVCSMNISENAPNHIIAKSTEPGTSALHVCSISCLRKVKKHDSKHSIVEFADFNQPSKFIPGDKAYFLVGSEKIKASFGDMAMPPCVAAFSTKKEADAAQAKVGDGTVVQGVENALK